MIKVSEDIAMRGEGSYTIKKISGQEYLYKGYYEKRKLKWKLLGNVKELDPKDPNLIKAKVVNTGREAKEIIERYYSGKLDKEKAVNEFKKLLER
jgi:hypothetical protein